MMPCTRAWAGTGPIRCSEEGSEANPSRPDIASLLSKFPERYRVPMILRYVKGLPAEQVAAILGRSLDCVRAQLNFGVNALRRALSDSRRARGRTSRKPSEEGA